MIYKIDQLEKTNISLDAVFNELSFLTKEYPHFYDWFYNKVVPGVEKGTRKVFVGHSSKSISKINGILILKDEIEEKKICTLYVNENDRFHGLGRQFIEIALNELDTSSPLITVSDSRLISFQKLLDKYNFKLYSKKENYYLNGSSEYAFNGIL